MHVILGMQEAHDASACLMVDGEVVAAAQEERFTGLKGDYGYPENAIEACLKTAGIKADQIDQVALASHNWNPVLTKIKRNANFSMEHWLKEQEEFWKPKLFEGKDINYYELFKDEESFRYDSTYQMDELLKGYMDKDEMKEMQTIRKRTISEKLGVPIDKLETITHEDCHVFYSYFASEFREKVLALTAEGVGDYSNGTVSEFEAESGKKELAHTKDNHLGHIYQYMTLLLGMKPAQHEYKVMGLAPYSNSKELERSYQVFKDLFKVEDLNIVFKNRPKDLYYHFRDALHSHRFDGIAGALQKCTEEILCEWVKTCIEATGMKKVCFAGGVAQNIKACKSLVEIDGLEDLYICPAAGDTSISIGACYVSMWKHCRDNKTSVDRIKPLENIYLGPEFSDEEILSFFDQDKTGERYEIVKNAPSALLADHLASGKIFARCVGRMEFGLRALGNRSIIADPRSADTVRRINSAIKFRDFWMPFTPSVLAERASDYIINPKAIRSPYMTMAFDSTELAQKELIASLHPADLTMRPQILEKHRNPRYYELIKEFEKITGVGGILNTSFNLHGDPIVLGPKEAVYTLDNSDLDGLILGDHLVLRKS